MTSSYFRTLPLSPPLATLSHVQSFGTLAHASRTGGGSGVTKEEAAVSVSVESLNQLAGSTSDLEGYESESNPDGPTIQEQIARLVRDREGNFSITLGKNLKKVSEKFLTSRRRGGTSRGKPT